MRLVKIGALKIPDDMLRITSAHIANLILVIKTHFIGIKMVFSVEFLASAIIIKERRTLREFVPTTVATARDNNNLAEISFLHLNKITLQGVILILGDTGIFVHDNSTFLF